MPRPTSRWSAPADRRFFMSSHPTPTSPALIRARPPADWPLLTLVLLLGLLVRALYLWQIGETPPLTVPYAGLDEALYRDLAARLRAGDLALGTEPYWFCAPYAYFRGALALWFGAGPWPPRIANLGLGLLTLVLIHRITRRLFPGRAAALLAALGAALYGPYVVFDTSAMKTSLGLCLTALAFLALLRALDPPAPGSPRALAWPRWIAAGSALGLALWFVPPLLILLVLVTAWVLSGRFGTSPLGRPRQRLRALLWLGAGLALVLLPGLVRTLLVSGEPVLLTSIGGIHLYIGNHPGATGTYTPVPRVRANPQGHRRDARQVAQQATGQPLGAGAASAWWAGQARAFMLEQPRAALALFGRKALLALNAYEVPNNETWAWLQARARLLQLLPGAALLLPLGLAGLVLGLGDLRRRLPLYLLFTSLLLGLVLTLVTWRYRLPLTLALWPAAGYALARGLHWLKGRRWLALAGLALLLLAGLLLSQWPLVDAAEQARHLRQAQGRFSASAQELAMRQQLAATPGPGDPARWLRLAQHRHRQLDWEGALAVLDEALQRHPDDRRLRQQRWQWARRLGLAEEGDGPLGGGLGPESFGGGRGHGVTIERQREVNERVGR